MTVAPFKRGTKKLAQTPILSFDKALDPKERWLAVGCAKSPEICRDHAAPETDTTPALILDAATGNTILTFNVQGAVRSVAFSSDSSQLATGGDDGIGRIWNTQSGEQVLSLSKENSPVCGIAFSPDNTQLATCAYTGTVRLWNATTAELIETLRTGSNRFRMQGSGFSLKVKKGNRVKTGFGNL